MWYVAVDDIPHAIGALEVGFPGCLRSGPARWNLYQPGPESFRLIIAQPLYKTPRDFGVHLPFETGDRIHDPWAGKLLQRLGIKRAEMRESPESGGEPSRISDQPILIEVVNAKLRI